MLSLQNRKKGTLRTCIQNFVLFLQSWKCGIYFTLKSKNTTAGNDVQGALYIYLVEHRYCHYRYRVCGKQELRKVF